jgi:hypothetical protein
MLVYESSKHTHSARRHGGGRVEVQDTGAHQAGQPLHVWIFG